MSTAQLIEKIESLPDAMKVEVEDFVEFLAQKKRPAGPKKERQYGAFEGKITMSPDFDEPLEDFKEYM